MAENADTRQDALTITQKKWSEPVIAAGWTVVPNVLIERQAELQLDAIDINIIMHLSARWWKAAERPRISKSTIARAMKVTPRTVQRRLAKLEKRGLVRRWRHQNADGTYRGTTNTYYLDGLIEACKPLARELSLRRAEARKARAGRSRLTPMEESA